MVRSRGDRPSNEECAVVKVMDVVAKVLTMVELMMMMTAEWTVVIFDRLWQIFWSYRLCWS